MTKLVLKIAVVLCVFPIASYANDCPFHDQENAPYFAPKVLEEVVIKKGEVAYLSHSVARVKRLIIRGTLGALDNRDITLYVEELIIDGGTLEIGTIDKERNHLFTIMFTTPAAHDNARIEVKNQGSMLLQGSSKKVLATSRKAIRKIGHTDHSFRTISIRTENDHSNGHVHVKKARTIKMSGVLFKGLGSFEGTPAFTWNGNTTIPGFINNSIFYHSKSTDLYLDRTSVAIENNTFVSKHGNSIVCSPSGLGVENNIEANLIENTSGDGLFAIVLMNPYQAVTNNRLMLSGDTNGIHFQRHLKFENLHLSNEDLFFVFEGNTLNRNIKNAKDVKDQKFTIGVKIDKFKHVNTWWLRNNAVANFGKNFVIKTKNVVIENYNYDASISKAKR